MTDLKSVEHKSLVWVRVPPAPLFAERRRSRCAAHTGSALLTPLQPTAAAVAASAIPFELVVADAHHVPVLCACSRKRILHTQRSQNALEAPHGVVMFPKSHLRGALNPRTREAPKAFALARDGKSRRVRLRPVHGQHLRFGGLRHTGEQLVRRKKQLARPRPRHR